MKIEVRCASCDRAFLVEESQLSPSEGQIPCPGCASPIDLPDPSAKSQRTAPAGPAPVAPPPAVSASAGPAAVAARAEAPAESPANVEHAESHEVVCPRCGLHFEPRAQPAGPSEDRRPTVLLVEDMEYFREIARDALSSRFEVKTAGSSEEALQILTAGGVDLLILDLTLDSSEGGIRLLQHFDSKPCPILIFTARDESEMYGAGWDELQALGADDMILKGINVGESLLRKACDMLGLSTDEEDLP